jgi:hypothetical protein
MWNESLDSRTSEVHEMHDEFWWDWLKDDMDGYWFMRRILESQAFNITDRFFFYDTESKMFNSFSTKQEFIEIVDESFFIDELINR